MKIYIHPGLTKTGSTAIQRYLYENAGALKDIGFYYPESINVEYATSGSYRSSGNGYDFYLKIKENSLNQKNKHDAIIGSISRWLEEANSKNCKNIVISSEVLCMLEQSDIDAIIEVFRELAIDFRFVYCIRNPYQWFFSSWLQQVKREGGFTWLSDLLVDNANFVLNPLMFPTKIKNSISSEFCIEHKYEDICSDLVNSFLASFGIPKEMHKLLAKPKTSITNRSVTDYEFAIFFHANKASGGNVKLSELLSSLVGDDIENKSRFFFVDKFSVDRITAWCHSNSPSLLNMYSESIKAMTAEAIHMSESDFVNSLSTNQILAIKSIEKITEYYQRIFDQARELAYHKSIYYANSEYAKHVPKDFNVFLYLVLNSDVLFSNLDPFWHFFEYGKDTNRIYRLP